MRRDGIWRVLGSLERRLGQTIEGLFPLRGSIQPIDVIEAVERILHNPRHRTPWRDGKVYAPNHYTVHLVCADERQREFLFAFLNDGELARAVRDEAKEEGYHFLSDPTFAIRLYDDRIPEHDDEVLWVEHSWVAPEAQADEHELPTEIRPWARLVVEAGPDQGLETLLAEPTVYLGRSQRMDNTVILQDPHVSRRHVRLDCVAPEAFVVENLRPGSNTMEVNGNPTDRAEITFGDRIAIGATVWYLALPAGRHAR